MLTAAGGDQQRPDGDEAAKGKHGWRQTLFKKNAVMLSTRPSRIFPALYGVCEDSERVL
jgi:hypothetical protein